MNSLSFCQISKRFKSVEALRDASVSIASGEALLLAGPNGAGKSTLINILLGLYLPDSGWLEVDGQRRSVDNALKSSMGYLPENVAFSENLSAWSMMKFYARARGVGTERMKEVLQLVGLSHAARKAISGFSKGMRQRLGLGIAILHEPDLLILDEPTSGLDQEGLSLLWEIVKEWRAAGRIVVISSHDLGVLEKRVDRLCVLRRGEVVACDSPRAIRQQANLPVHVEVSTDGDVGAADDLRALLSRFERVHVNGPSPTEIRAEIEAGNLVALMDALFAEHRGHVASLQVIEPEMESIYEHLLEQG